MDIIQVLNEAVVPPKTELSRRTLPLPRFAVKRLRELKPREGGRLIDVARNHCVLPSVNY